jgi:hypothetical protein
VSPLELVDDRFDKLAEELRAGRPIAPDALRQRVLSLAPPPPPRFELNLRRRAPVAALAGLVAALGAAAVLGIVHGSSSPGSPKGAARAPQTARAQQTAPRYSDKRSTRLNSRATVLSKDGLPFAPSQVRLQRYDAFMRVRVRDQDELSQHTQDALRLARKLDGYVVWARYAAPRQTGDSELLLRIPVENVQAAIAAFSGYGTLVRQRIVLKDLQQRVDSLTARIARLRREIAKTQHDPALRQRLRQRLAALTAQKGAAVKRAQLATVALTMVVGTEPAAAHGRFRRTIDDAVSVLARELEILLYAALVAGPLLLLGAAGIMGGRSLRRRADSRLLERS